MGVHESQSLLWERMVALSQPFAHYLLPKLQEHFPDLAQKLSPESLYSAVNVIREPSMIRVEADEVTYPLHIILRCVEVSMYCGMSSTAPPVHERFVHPFGVCQRPLEL